MGLFISALIANSLSKEFQIDVESKLMKGSTFSFYIDNQDQKATGLNVRKQNEQS